jgi:hypothetical protein
MASQEAIGIGARRRLRVAGSLESALGEGKRFFVALYHWAQKNQLGRTPGTELGRHLGGRC